MTERIHRLPIAPRADRQVRTQGPWPAAVPAHGGGQVRPSAQPSRQTYSEPDILWLLKALVRRWWLILLVFLLVTSTVYTLLQLRTPQFNASTEILIERDETEFANLRERLDFSSRDIEAEEMETYLRILRSDQTALSVIDRLDLWNTPAPPSNPMPWEPAVDWLRSTGQAVAANIGDTLGIGAEEAEDGADAPAGDPEERMISRFHSKLDIGRDPLAHVISVGYRSSDPQYAAEVANTVAQVFLEELVRAQRAMLSQNADYLRERVESLREELDEAEVSSSEYQSRSELYEVEGGSAAELRYAELTRELLAAEAELGRSRARSAQIGPGGRNLAGIEEGLSSPVITDLRRQEAEVAREIADMRSTFGDRHPLMIQRRAELEDIRSNIREEQGRIAAQVQGEVSVAEQRVASLRRELANAEGQLTSATGAQAELNTLVSRADTTRRLYEDMLGRYQRATEQQHLLRPAARVISPARAPGKPDTKKNILILGFFGFSSIAGGMGLALLLELMRRGYETAEELESHTHMPVFGSLPLVGGKSAEDPIASSNELAAIVFAEAVQRLSVRLVPVGRTDDLGQVVMVTSAMPNEGKTTVSLSLARQMAAAGLSVVLIDADLRKRSLEAQVERAPGRRAGLLDLLAGNVFDINEAVVRDDRSGLDFLLANHTPPQPLRLLGSPAMAQLTDELRRRYDVVLIDTPPILALSDYAVIAPLVDQLLFVVQWRRTSRRAVQTALKELAANDAPLSGLVLNQVRLAAYRRRTDGDSLSYYKTTSRYYRST